MRFFSYERFFQAKLFGGTSGNGRILFLYERNRPNVNFSMQSTFQVLTRVTVIVIDWKVVASGITLKLTSKWKKGWRTWWILMNQLNINGSRLLARRNHSTSSLATFIKQAANFKINLHSLKSSKNYSPRWQFYIITAWRNPWKPKDTQTFLMLSISFNMKLNQPENPSHWLITSFRLKTRPQTAWSWLNILWWDFRPWCSFLYPQSIEEEIWTQIQVHKRQDKIRLVYVMLISL